MRRIIFLASLTIAVVAMVACAAGTAFAYTDYTPYLNKGVTGPGTNTATLGDGTVSGAYALACYYCHGWDKATEPNTTDQVNVQAVYAGSGLLGSSEPLFTNVYMQYGQPWGPHGGYTNTTDRCKVCHDVHNASGDLRLLPGNTVAEICETCHDFTEGISIYGAIRAETGEAPGAVHGIYGLQSSEGSDTATTGQYIPGGDFDGAAGVDPTVYPNTGGAVLFDDAGTASDTANLTCTDCHTPHGNTAMRPFKDDRVRLGSAILIASCNIQPANITETQFGVTLPVLGPIPAGTPLTAALPISPSSPIYIPGAVTEVSPAGTALAVSLIAAGVLDITVETTVAANSPYNNGTTGIMLYNAHLTSVASNKLLRDYIGGAGGDSISGRGALDLRDPDFGGTAPNAALGVTYDTEATQWDPVLGGDDENSLNAPWNQGQNGGTAIYGSGFCYACHRGRLGNMYGGLGGVEIDGDFTAENVGSANNHPTNMKLAYSAVGSLTSAGEAAPFAPAIIQEWLVAGGHVTGGPISDPVAAGYPMGMMTGLALSNAGYVMEPVNLDNHPDGSVWRGDTTVAALGTADEQAPICQQCHEDSRDLSETFVVYDTDKNVPFDEPVNTVLGLDKGSVTQTFIYDSPGNPQFANFPHETENARLLVEGGDSNQPGGGQNDDLCLNCHIPGSFLRIDDGNTVPSATVAGRNYGPHVITGVGLDGVTPSSTKVGDGFME